MHRILHLLLTGKLEKIKDGIIYLNIYENDKTIQDSAVISDGNFKFTGFVTSSFFCNAYHAEVKPNDYFTFYIEPVNDEYFRSAATLLNF